MSKLSLFLLKTLDLREKRLHKMLPKRRPAKLKQYPIPMPGGSRRSGLACALFRQETVVRATVEALFEILAEKSENDRNPCKELTGLLNRWKKN